MHVTHETNITIHCLTLPSFVCFYILTLATLLNAGLYQIVLSGIMGIGRLPHIIAYFIGAANALVVSEPIVIFYIRHRKF